MSSKNTNAARLSGICAPALVTGLPAIMGGGYFHRAFYRLSRPVGHFVVAALAECLVFAGWPDPFQQPVHHWQPSS
ncbi:MAG TPA: hypothetical protein VGI45_11595 [Terracidiphilus sp.]